jgi:hypothetical protein
MVICHISVIIMKTESGLQLRQINCASCNHDLLSINAKQPLCKTRVRQAHVQKCKLAAAAILNILKITCNFLSNWPVCMLGILSVNAYQQPPCKSVKCNEYRYPRQRQPPSWNRKMLVTSEVIDLSARNFMNECLSTAFMHKYNFKSTKKEIQDGGCTGFLPPN